MPDPAARIALAALAQRAARGEYLSALRAGRRRGMSFADMGRAAGVSRQAVRQLLQQRGEK